MAYQSLYRRYRPRRFDEVRGQEHVVGALRNAVNNGTEGHAYLFSGPRGTGKTSTARILAKALNCENLQQGEPCCDCTPCQDMEAGRSFDLFELDAASNNGVDAIRDLIERTVVGSPGRTKVYILDEVHMLSPGASNALLKTLEEPPDHVRFVLATTDPQKVLPTIKSRTQHYEFQLLSAAELEAYVRWIVADADLEADDTAIAWVVRQGRGSARDTLSALDQVVAAGGVLARAEPVDQLFESLARRDSSVAIVAVAEALSQGHDPRVLGKSFLDALRDTFLLSLGVEVPHLVDADREGFEGWAAKIGTPTLTRAMESVGSALVEMRQAADPRVPLEVALVRLTLASASTPDDLVRRIEALEQAVASGASVAGGPASQATAAPATGPSTSEPADAGASTPVVGGPGAASSAAEHSGSSTRGGDGPAQARAALAKLKDERARKDPSGGRTTASPSSSPSAERPTPTPPPPVPGSAAPASPSAPPPTPPRPGPQAPPADALPADDASAASPQPTPRQSQSESSPAEPSPADSRSAAPTAPGSKPGSSTGPDEGSLDVESLQAAFEERVLPQLKGVAKAIYSTGRFVSSEAGVAVFELDNVHALERAEKKRSEVDSILAEALGRPIDLQLVAASDRPPGAGGAGGQHSEPAGTANQFHDSSAAAEQTAAEELDEALTIDVTELEDAGDVAVTGYDRLAAAFPGATLIDPDEVK